MKKFVFIIVFAIGVWTENKNYAQSLDIGGSFGVGFASFLPNNKEVNTNNFSDNFFFQGNFLTYFYPAKHFLNSLELDIDYSLSNHYIVALSSTFAYLINTHYKPYVGVKLGLNYTNIQMPQFQPFYLSLALSMGSTLFSFSKGDFWIMLDYRFLSSEIKEYYNTDFFIKLGFTFKVFY